MEGSLTAVSGFSNSPALFMRHEEVRQVELGVSIASLAPQCQGMLVCRVNGEWLLRESWDSLVREDDVIEWYEVAQDRDTLRGVLSIAAIAVLGPYGLGLQGAALIAANLAAQFAINALLPPSIPEQQARPGQTGDSFSSSLQGNIAALDQPIPRYCGHKEVNPRFACDPYLEFLPREGEEDEDLDNDQYFYALYAVGIGDYDVFAKIGNTPISRFADVLRADYLAPGVQPTEVLANVTTADEVSGQILESGRYVGGFAACAARRTCAAIGVDVSATRGLGKEGALTVEWRVEYRAINNFGQVLGPWVTLANESRTAFTATPQRWSSKYELATASRVEVRVVRTDVQDTDPSALHEIAWIGLRAYLDEPAPLNAECAHFEVVLRASSQLSQAASRDLRLITRGKCRSLDSNLDWVAEAYTRNPFWWALDLVSSDTWGMNKPDDRIDLQSFYDLAIQADERQDRFDYAFDSTLSGWDALQLICRAGRARAFRRNGVISVARDELAEVPVTAFTHRNCLPGIEVSESTRQRNSPDGVIIEYQDHRTNEWTPIECPCPGISLTDMVNPVRKRLEGVTGATHAEREGLYEAASLLYRTRSVRLTTEMEGMLPAYLSPVRVIPDQLHYGQAGDVAFWDPDTLVMGLSEQPRWDSDETYITLVRDDGSLTDPVLVTPGPTEWDVTLPTGPDFTIVVDNAARERPKFMLGTQVGASLLVKVRSIEDGGQTEEGAQLYSLSGEVDDSRVHEADNDLLPGPDDDQDPVGLPDDSDDEEESGTLVVPRILDFYVYAVSTETSYTDDLIARVTFRNDGRLLVFTDQQFDGGSSFRSGEWNLYGEIESSDAALYDIRATVLTSVDGDSPVTFTGTTGSWLNLGTSRVWEITTGYVDPGWTRTAIRNIRFEIRETSTGIVQDTGVIDLRTFFDAGLGGGGA